MASAPRLGTPIALAYVSLVLVVLVHVRDAGPRAPAQLLLGLLAGMLVLRDVPAALCFHVARPYCVGAAVAMDARYSLRASLLTFALLSAAAARPDGPAGGRWCVLPNPTMIRRRTSCNSGTWTIIGAAPLNAPRDFARCVLAEVSVWLSAAGLVLFAPRDSASGLATVAVGALMGLALRLVAASMCTGVALCADGGGTHAVLWVPQNETLVRALRRVADVNALCVGLSPCAPPGTGETVWLTHEALWGMGGVLVDLRPAAGGDAAEGRAADVQRSARAGVEECARLAWRPPPGV